MLGNSKALSILGDYPDEPLLSLWNCAVLVNRERQLVINNSGAVRIPCGRRLRRHFFYSMFKHLKVWDLVQGIKIDQVCVSAVSGQYVISEAKGVE